MSVRALVALGLAAGLVVTTAAAAQAQGTPGRTAVLRALDKISGKTRDIPVQVGKVVEYGSLKIRVRGCERSPETEAPENAVFIEVEDAPPARGKAVQAEPKRIFSGWIYSSVPALSALEHPVYDVWAIDCRS